MRAKNLLTLKYLIKLIIRLCYSLRMGIDGSTKYIHVWQQDVIYLDLAKITLFKN